MIPNQPPELKSCPFCGKHSVSTSAFVTSCGNCGASAPSGWWNTRNASPEVSLSSHPEDKCQRCGNDNVVWFAPNELWNKFSTESILCPVCFVKSCEKSGFVKVWKLAPEAEPTPQVLKPKTRGEFYLAIEKVVEETALYSTQAAGILRIIDEIAAQSSAEKQKQIDLHCLDWAEAHTHAQNVALKLGVPKEKVEGDSNAVPGIVDLIDMIAEQAEANGVTKKKQRRIDLGMNHVTCGCNFDEAEETILKPCLAHHDWKAEMVKERDAEIERLRSQLLAIVGACEDFQNDDAEGKDEELLLGQAEMRINAICGTASAALATDRRKG